MIIVFFLIKVVFFYKYNEFHFKIATYAHEVWTYRACYDVFFNVWRQAITPRFGGKNFCTNFTSMIVSDIHGIWRLSRV
jgi:hypothetical protein